MAFRELVIEAAKKTSIVANKIASNLDLPAFKNISRMEVMDKNYLLDFASNKYIYFDDLSDNDKQEVIEKIWQKVKSGEFEKMNSDSEEIQTEANSEKPLSQSELKQKIIDYVHNKGAVLYPLESAAEDLAIALSSEEKTEEKCSCCGKTPCECASNCDCKKEDLEDTSEEQNNTYDDKAGVKRTIERYMQDRGEDKIIGESITEAVMNDIPHEIDDQIHTLKDMRFDLEQTQKNWNIAGLKTEPMDEILKNIDDLIASLYQNGAKMADDEISKGNSEEPKEDEKQEKEKSIQGDK